MEYEDELDRMRARKQRQKAWQQSRQEGSERLSGQEAERRGRHEGRMSGQDGERPVRRGGRVSGRETGRTVHGEGRVSGREAERQLHRESRTLSQEAKRRPVRRKVRSVDEERIAVRSRKQPIHEDMEGSAGRSSSRRPSRQTEEQYKAGGRRRGYDTPEADETEDGEAPKKRRRKKKHRFTVLKILLLLVVLAGVYIGYQWIKAGSGFWTIAVFGVDSRKGNLEAGALSDVEMLCVINRKTGEIKLVSVYRDTYMEISPDGTYHKINEAYFKGGHEQAISALERNLDLQIDDYATFNWKAVADAITILGGIDLEISDSEFKYINGFITETVESTGLGSHHLEHAGMNHLDGVQAVAYARLRLMDTDYNRTARQRLVIQLAMNKAKEADFKTLTTLIQAIVPQLSTSIGVDDILPMARRINKYHIGENGGFPFSRGETHIGKKDCVIPLTLESNVVQLHQFLYGTENYQPSETVRKISAKIASDSGMGQVAENAPEARVAGQKALEGSDSSNNSGSSSGNGSSGNKGTESASSQETVSDETTASETVTESTSSEESSAGETMDSSEESGSDETDASTEQSEPISGPGSQLESSGTSDGPAGPAGPGSSENPGGSEGPGGIGGPGSSQSPGQTGDHIYEEKPVAESTEAVGPGV